MKSATISGIPVIHQNTEFSLFKDFPEPVFIIDPEGFILEANQVFISKFFSKLVDVRGMNVFELVSSLLHEPELAISRKAKVDSVISTGHHIVFDDEYNGHTLRNSIYPIKSPEGATARLLIIVHDVTRQVAAERQARHTDHVFKALLDAIPGSVFILDEESLLLGCNEYAFELFGDPKGQIRNNNFFDLVYHEDQQRVKNKLTRLMESGTEETDEARMHIHEKRSDYSWFSIHAQKTVIENRNYLVLVCIDITKHKNAESHLLAYKKWVITAMDAGNTGVWDWNIVTDAALWSNSMWDIYGIERLPGQYPSFKLWETAVHSDDRTMVVEAVRQAVSQLADLNIEYRVVHPDGSIRWILINGKPVYNKHGKVNRYCGTSIDITDQRQLEDEITLSREHLDLALEKCHIGWFHLNLKDYSAIRTIEHARIFGYDDMASEWSFEKFLEHVVEEDRERIRKLVTESIASNKDYTSEFRIVNANGEIRSIWTSATIQLDRHGKATHIMGIIQDITGRRHD